MNYINAIQEYCQKNKIEFPKYDGSSIGPPHNPKWNANVSLWDGYIFEGSGKTFKEAKQDAAQWAYKHIISKNTKKKEQIALTNKKKNLSNCSDFYIIDLDNYNKFLTDYTLGIQKDPMIYNNSLFLIYAYRNNPLIDDIRFKELGLKINVIDLDDRDATDFYMTFQLGQYLIKNKELFSLTLSSYRSFYILTNDHFGKILAFLIKQFFKDNCNVDDIDKYYKVECHNKLNFV